MADDVTQGSKRSQQLGSEFAALAAERGLSVACAESLTAGALASRLGAAEGSADWFRGGVVAYGREVKHGLLRVPEGPVVSETSARAMAESTAELLEADLVVAVTGAGGPEGQDGRPPGTVWFAVTKDALTETEEKHFPGGPPEVLAQTVQHALGLLVRRARA